MVKVTILCKNYKSLDERRKILKVEIKTLAQLKKMKSCYGKIKININKRRLPFVKLHSQIEYICNECYRNQTNDWNPVYCSSCGCDLWKKNKAGDLQCKHCGFILDYIGPNPEKEEINSRQM